MRAHLSAVLFVIGVVAALAAENPPESYVKLMKDTNAAMQSLRGHVQAKDYAGMTGDAAALKRLFADVEAFWTARKADDAIGFARTAGKAASALEAAAATKNDDALATAARTVNGTCMGCHTAHRERLPDGSSQIKH
jgi:mono/diheme cytochrome c family protein